MMEDNGPSIIIEGDVQKVDQPVVPEEIRIDPMEDMQAEGRVQMEPIPQGPPIEEYERKFDFDLLPEGDKRLYEPTQDWDFDNPPYPTIEFAQELAYLMRKNTGLGIAAPQVGVPYNVFILEGRPQLACFNPTITSHGEEDILLDEGCLSFPYMFVKIKRPRMVRVRFRDVNGTPHVQVFDGMTSRVFQHEYDHLQGIDFLTRASKIHVDRAKKKRKQIMKKVKRGQIKMEVRFAS